MDNILKLADKKLKEFEDSKTFIAYVEGFTMIKGKNEREIKEKLDEKLKDLNLCYYIIGTKEDFSL